MNVLKTKRKSLEERRFKLQDVGSKKIGGLFETRVGLANVYKRLHAGSPFFTEKGIIDDALKGYELLKSKGLPVTERKGTVVIRGQPRLVFEKARDIRPEELDRRLRQIVSIIRKANREDVYLDVILDNFGINQKGKIVIRDTSSLSRMGGRGGFKSMLDDLERSLSRSNPYHIEAKKRLRKMLGK